MGSDAHHELVADDSASHVPTTQEAQAAEHLSLACVRVVSQERAHSLRESFVKRHAGSVLVSSR